MPKQSNPSLFSHRTRIKIPWPKLAKALIEPNLPLRANERAVALTIFLYADMTTLTCYPSIREIARHAGVGRNTVCRAIRKMKEIGLVIVTKKHRQGGKFAGNEYDFNILRTRINRISNKIHGVPSI